MLSSTAVGYGAEPAPRPAAEALSKEPWQPYKSKHGINVERRAVPGSKYFEYRAMISAPVPPPIIMEQLWSRVHEAANVVKKRQVIKQSPNEVVLYDQIRTPVVSDRDYTLSVRKVVDLEAHRFQLIYETANELGPPVDPKFVRIPKIRGGWTVESDGTPAGGSRMTYQSYSEPGGSIPAFLIHGAQFDQVIKDVEGLQERIRNLPAAATPPPATK